jgi:hypothetical protein
MATTDDSLQELKAALLEGMREYMGDGGVSYEEPDVLRCGEILDEFEWRDW